MSGFNISIRPPPSPKQNFPRIRQRKLCCAIELYYGAYKSARREANLAVMATLRAGFGSLPFDGEAARISGEIRASLARKGTPIGTCDLQMTSIALANNCTLVTHNTGEFSRIAGLGLEDWEVEK